MHNLSRKILSTNLIKSMRQTFFKSTSRLHLSRPTRENATVLHPTTESPIPLGVMGQPTCHTHPHLIGADYLTDEVTQAEYKGRREELVKRLIEKCPNQNKSHVIVIPAACKQYMSGNIPYVFRQHSDFYYLTGSLEPGATLVLVKPEGTSESYKSILFVHEKDSHAELWDGPRTGCEAAPRLFCVDEARPLEKLKEYLDSKVSESKPTILWYAKEENPTNTAVENTIKALSSTHTQQKDPKTVIHSMRIIKSEAEIELMRKTCEIGAQAINTAMACTNSGESEHHLCSVIEYSSKLLGAEHSAFPAVVAGGSRATTIHYVHNNQILLQDQMVLVDAGCQRSLYNSDISRTWPVSGKFSPHHRILYEIVLTTQKRLIEILGEYRPPLDQLFEQMCRLLGTHLQQEGILDKKLNGQDLVTAAYQFCPHHVSHYLGLDVHDTSTIKRNQPVRTGMIVTVEPGIYIRSDDESVPPEFRGVGIRIEDDVLVTDEEPFVLTESCAKEVDDIEQIVGTQSLLEA